MKILFATAEAGPFIRTGGLGDVAAALPPALVKEGQEVNVVLPLYQDIPDRFRQNMRYLGNVIVPLGWRQQYAGLFSYAYQGVNFYFIDNEYYFKRHGLYGHFDDGERFAFFSKAILEVMPLMSFYPDVLHCNDWQTALAPLMLDLFYRERWGYKFMKTVLSIHNIEFQGAMDKFVIEDVFGIPASHYRIAEYRNNANMLKAGIECANRVVTVSPTYAKEILDPYYAYGLEKILDIRQFKLSGILNGIDTELYDPMKDPALFQHFSVKSIKRKAKNKSGLQELLGLPVVDRPMIGMVTRLTPQKGLDLVLHVIDELMSKDIQLVILGTGDWKYESAFQELAKRYPHRLAAVINFSADLASKIYAASDMFLMPSKYEPCGLSQMIAMRYGSIPIVRETGGLKDSVVPFNPVEKTGTGFTFKTFNAYDMLDAINRALGSYYNEEEWKAVVTNAMSEDFSWRQSAKKYIELFESIE